MYILKNALRNISRSKGRNILIGIIVLVIAISSCVTLSIKQSAIKTKESYQENLKITAQISVDRQSLMQNSSSGGEAPDRDSMKSALQGIGELTLDDMKTYAGASSVEDFYYSSTASLNADEDTDLEAVTTTTEDTSSTDGTQQGNAPEGMEQMGGDKGGPKMSAGMGEQGDFTVVGYSSHSAMTDFVSGTSTITDGTVFDEDTSDMVCIISDELAAYNSLSVGDTISLVNPNDEDEKYELEIVGIYNNSESSVSVGGMMGGFSTMSDPANKIYTSYDTLNSIITTSSENATTETDDETGMEQTTAIRQQVSGTYVFSDLASYEVFEDEVRDLGLDDTYTVSSSDVTSYEQSIEPLENLSKFATYFLVIVLIIGAIILIVLNLFNIRERKYEIGVLTAIGMKKGKVATQFIIELFTVTFIAILLGTVIGSAVSLPVTNKLLESQIESQQEQSQAQMNNFGKGNGANGGGNMPSMDKGNFGRGESNVNYISEVSSATDITVVMQLIGIGIILTIISSCTAVIFVLRYEPLKILTNRD